MKINNKYKVWLKRFGVTGVILFLAKGLIWIAILFGLGSSIFS